MHTYRVLGRLRTVVAHIGLLAGALACATSTQPLAPGAAAHLQKIALLEVTEPEGYGATNLSLEGIGIGLSGGHLVNEQHRDQFTNALRERGFSLSKVITGRLVSALRASGIEVEQIQATRKGFSLVAHADTNADAILDVWVAANYVAAYGLADYKPSVVVMAQLLDNKKDKERRIYFDHFSYGSSSSGEAIEAPAMYSYSSFEQLMQRSEEAGDGLLKGALLITDRLVVEITPAKH